MHKTIFCIFAALAILMALLPAATIQAASPQDPSDPPQDLSLPDGLTDSEWQSIKNQITSNLSQNAYVKASNTNEDDNFGWSVAISGETIVVGAYYEDSAAKGVGGDQNSNAAPDSGAVYVFVRNGNSWTQQAYLKASNTNEDDCFGYSVAISGDTIVVGAPYEASSATGIGGDQNSNSASGAGAVYVFSRSNGVWSQQAYIKASNTNAGDFFGWSVAISGDTAVVGAYGESSNAKGVGGDQSNNGAPSAGAAYVFTRASGTWTQQAYLKASNTNPADVFGWSVAIYDQTIVVSALFEDSAATGIGGDQNSNSASASGAVYVFTRTNSVWSQQAYLKASNTGAGDYFGYSIAISGSTVVVGAISEDSNATGVGGNQADNSAPDSGAAYVFVRSGTTWSQQAYLKASNTGSTDTFGNAVAIDGGKIIVGANYEDSSATGVDGDQGNNSQPDSGAAYVFTRNGSAWSQTAYLKASNTEAQDCFAKSVGVYGLTIVAGANLESSKAKGIDGDQTDNSMLAAGAIYIFTSPVINTNNTFLPTVIR